MRVFLAGATGAIGRRLVPQLVDRGHDVTATTTTPDKLELLRISAPSRWSSTASTRPPWGKQWPRGRRRHSSDDRACRGSRPPPVRSVVCTHERAADDGNREPARRGTRLGRETVRRPELHRLAERPRGRPGQVGGRSARSDPPAAQTASLAAIRFLEQAVLDAPLEGAVLRYGGLYGPGASEGLRAGPRPEAPDRGRRLGRLVLDPRR